MELDEKMLEKAKNAKSVEELLSLAKENGIELTVEEAKTYFAKLNAKSGELADDELDDVSGGEKCGTIYSEGRPLVTVGNSCEHYINENTQRKEDGSGKCPACYWSDSTGCSLYCCCPKRYYN